jgi:hypothetical protein
MSEVTIASGLGFFSGPESSAVLSASATCGSIETGVGFKVVVVVVFDRPFGAGFMLVVRWMLVVWISGSGPLQAQVEPVVVVRRMPVVWMSGCGPLEQQGQAAVVFDSQWHRRARSR